MPDETRIPPPSCPRCGYDLRGEIATWTAACPTAGRCVECGLDFAWFDLLDPRAAAPRWCVEGVGSGRGFGRRSIATTLRTLVPWRFWSGLRMSHPGRPGRIGVLLGLSGLLLVVLLVTVAAAMAADDVRRLSVNAAPGAATITPAGAFGGVLLRPWSGASLGQIVAGRAAFPLRAPRWYVLALLAQHGLAALLLLGAHGLTTLSFATLPVSRRRAKVRWAHVVRVGFYGAIPLVGVLAFGLVALGLSRLLPGASGALLTATVLVLVLVLPWEVTWWSCATGRYLRMSHPWGVGLAVVVMGFLGALAGLAIIDPIWQAARAPPGGRGPVRVAGSRYDPRMTTTTADVMIPASLDAISRSVLELLGAHDAEVASVLGREAERQATTLELIASENHVSPAVMHTMGTWMTNKYAEGYPGKRYYGGCVFHDEVEDLARDRAKKLFRCGFANVQPHSGASANIAAFMALLEPGDRILSLPIKSGGHLSHGLKPNFSGTFYEIVDYDLDPETERLDYDAIERLARETRPKLIICGYSAYSRTIDFARFRAIADAVDAFLLADVAHIAGLIAAGVHPSPFPHAHVVTTTTHKTLRGPRGGLILSDDEEIAKRVDRKVFPGSQGGPLMHVIAAKAVAFGEALQPSFTAYSKQIVANAQALAAALTERGYRLCSGGTDNHLMLVDLRPRDEQLTGADAERWLETAGIIVNKNGIPNDPRKPMVTSGLRLGTPALTTRGMKEPEMVRVAELLDRVMGASGDEGVCAEVRAAVAELCGDFALPH